MSYQEKIIEIIRSVLAALPDVSEKKCLGKLPLWSMINCV